MGFTKTRAVCCPSSCKSCGGDFVKCTETNGQKNVARCCVNEWSPDIGECTEPQRDARICSLECYVPPVISHGFYEVPLRNWLSNANVRIAWAHEVAGNPQAFMKSVTSFIGIPTVDPEIGTLAGRLTKDVAYGENGKFVFDLAKVSGGAVGDGDGLGSFARKREMLDQQIEATTLRNLTNIYYASNVKLLGYFDTLSPDQFLGSARRMPDAWLN